MDFYRCFRHIFLDLHQRRDFKTLAHERITDFLDSITNYITILVHYHVCNSLFIVLLVFTEVCQSFTARHTEKHAIHALLFAVTNGASHESDLHTAFYKCLSRLRTHLLDQFLALRVCLVRARWFGITQHCRLRMHKFKNFIVVFHLIKVNSHFSNRPRLSDNKAFFVLDIGIDGIKEQLGGASLVSHDSLNIIDVRGDALRPVNLNAHVLALVEEIV